MEEKKEECQICHGKKEITYEDKKAESIIFQPCPLCVGLSSCKKNHELINFYYKQCPMCLLVDELEQQRNLVDEMVRKFVTKRSSVDRALTYIKR